MGEQGGGAHLVDDEPLDDAAPDGGVDGGGTIAAGDDAHDQRDAAELLQRDADDPMAPGGPAFASLGVDEAAEPMTWTLRVERETLRSAANCDKLQAALAEAVKKPVRLVVEAGPTEDTPARRDAIERARRQAEAEQIIHDDPLVQALMAQYKTARIVPGSVKPH